MPAKIKFDEFLLEHSESGFAISSSDKLICDRIERSYHTIIDDKNGSMFSFAHKYQYIDPLEAPNTSLMSTSLLSVFL